MSDILLQSVTILRFYISSKFISQVSHSSYLSQMEGLPGNSKSLYRVCDSESEESRNQSIFNILWSDDGTTI